MKTADKIIVETNPPEERDYISAEWDQMWAKFEHNLNMADIPSTG